MSQALLELRSINKTYGSVQVLHDINFSLRPGEVHCLAGGNGCGKSTMIKTVSGAIQPDAGSKIMIDGKDIDSMTPAEAKARGIQVIYQDLSLFPNLTVAENIAIDLVLTSGLRAPSRSEVLKVATAAAGFIHADFNFDALVEDLPVSSRQLIAIARALAAEARIIFMDEPTASLTDQEVRNLLSVVQNLRKDGISVVFVSHRLKEVMTIADRVSVMRDGRMVGCFDVGDVNERRLAELMTGASFDYQPGVADHPGEVVFEVEGLSRQGEFEDISFKLKRGEVLGLTGLLGAGRTELAHALFGMTRPDSGKMTLAGEAFAPRNNRQAIERGVSYLSEDRMVSGLVLDQSISDNFVLSVLRRISNRLGLVQGGDKDRVVTELIGDLDVKVADPALPVVTLSGGNQQRVSLGKNIASDPKVIILDSPSVGVDIGAKDAIYQAISKLSSRGMAVILISDELEEVHYHANRVLVLENGKIVHTHIPETDTMEGLDDVVFH